MPHAEFPNDCIDVVDVVLSRPLMHAIMCVNRSNAHIARRCIVLGGTRVIHWFIMV